MNDETLRQGFKQFNRFMLLMWRLGMGRWLNAWPEWGGQILVLTHTGRKSGIQRRTPVNYAWVNGELYITAGFGKGCDWYRNTLANPQVEIWLPDSWWQGTAEDVSTAENRLDLMRAVLIGSGFAARVAGINPHTISDAELDQQSKEYKLVHVTGTAARTGPGGPGDLAWIWPVATFLLLPLAFRRRKTGCCGKCK